MISDLRTIARFFHETFSNSLAKIFELGSMFSLNCILVSSTFGYIIVYKVLDFYPLFQWVGIA